MLLNSDIIRKLVPTSSTLKGWVNGNLYVQTTETFGILPVPSNVQESTDILPFDPNLVLKRHGYLARKQGTRFAVLTLHTDEEKKLFSRLMNTENSFKRPQGPDWAIAVRIWNQNADGKTIFYKVSQFRF
jgi:hypothetical protein